ncbi:hypothetical protein PPERSA_06789 [Pseudocohnilembus persalinus]|uniref:Armadillo-type fold n=1 Tax=Pseudocohnilembus persalinus TaxID=266149 RepID=A0A0V0QS65_PSEPJ|nr:hypothetical protein PPERSA_06789 [Pseudocohnilembus persalinus]|eukprot:KRX05155.1 hypothetical protein PPERSA_06789 [Pseudocohnilembus persalinus]
MFRAITKLSNISKNLSTKPAYFSYYSDQYVQPWNVTKRAYAELVDAIGSAHNCHMIGELLKENLMILTDYQLSYAINHIWNNNLELDEHFYGVILPIVKEYVKKFDRECNKSLYEITKYCGWMEVQDKGLWELLDKKLVDERLVRYIPLEELINVAHALAQNRSGSKQLFDTIEGQVIKHRLGLTPSMIHTATQAFQQYGEASPLVFKVLENPVNVDIASESKKLNE